MNLKAIGRFLLVENPPRNLSGKNRFQNLDVLKLMSLVLVLCLHCAGSIWWEGPETLSLWSVTRFVYCLGVLAIPTFFVVSGYQLLGRDRGDYRYSARKIINLLKVTFIFYLFIKALCWLLWDEPVEVSQIPVQFFLSLCCRGDFSLIWFVGGLILIYGFYPPVNRLYREKKSWYLWLCGGLLLFQTFIFVITIVRPSGFCLRETFVPQTFRIWNWLGYFCLGGLIKRYEIFRYLGRLPFVVAMSVICFVFLNRVMVLRGIWYCEYCYDSIPVILFVTAVFAYVLKFRINSRFMVEMSVVFFPAYILGDMFIAIFWRGMICLPEPIAPVVFVGVTACCSVASGWLIMKIPVVRKLLSL